MHHERQKLLTNPTANIERLVTLILQHKFKMRFRSIGWKSQVIRTWVRKIGHSTQRKDKKRVRFNGVYAELYIMRSSVSVRNQGKASQAHV
uniref:Uncharacterized protein n=1 Tax=Trichogramma kaykai TaxID=54128 RepID=A0ABD2WLR7_9HYME